MAEIVLGIGTSHGPLLSTPPEKWDLRAQADRVNKQHHFRGRSYDYESLLKERAPGFANEMTIEARRDRHARCQRALDAVGRKFKDVAPEAFVIVGNDQREIFSNDLTPAITIFRGQEIENIPDKKPEVSPGLKAGESGNCPLEGAKLAFAAAEAAYKDKGASEKLKISVAKDSGHTVTADQRKEALDWFEKWLK